MLFMASVFKRGRLGYPAAMFEPTFDSADDWVEFIRGTLVPDLEASGSDSLAQEFTTLAGYAADPVLLGRNAGYEEFLGRQLIPDLVESGQEATAHDLQEGLYWWVGRGSEAPWGRDAEPMMDASYGEGWAEDPTPEEREEAEYQARVARYGMGDVALNPKMPWPWDEPDRERALVRAIDPHYTLADDLRLGVVIQGGERIADYARHARGAAEGTQSYRDLPPLFEQGAPNYLLARDLLRKADKSAQVVRRHIAAAQRKLNAWEAAQPRRGKA